MNTIAGCKQRLPLPDLLVRLGLFEHAPKAGNHPCPLHGERKGAAFGLTYKTNAWVWNCHGKCATGGDEVTLLQAHFGLSLKDALQRYESICGAHRVPPSHSGAKPPEPTRSVPPELKFLNLPPLHKGSYDECATVSKLRAVPPETVLAMSKAGFLAFADVAGFASWIVLDETRLLAEARRMDGKH